MRSWTSRTTYFAPRYREYVPAAKLHLYNSAWVDRLVEALGTAEGFRSATEFDPIPKPSPEA